MGSTKAKMRLVYRCSECAATAPKWGGQCVSCQAWNSMVEDVEGLDTSVSVAWSASSPEAIQVTSVDALMGGPQPTRIDELDRVLGGGLVPGSVALVGGEPGIGKSTLLLQLAATWPGSVLYVCAEESAQQVRLRADRLGAVRPDLWLLPATVLQHIVAALDQLRPSLVIVDSIQTIADPEVGSAPGSVVQVRGCAHRLVSEAKQRNVPMVLVGHVTKEGSLAGPRLLEHVVDTVLAFEGDRHHALRLLRAVKHRFGPTNELGVFEMAEAGLVGVPDASALFLSDRRTGVPGSVVTATLEGQRPLLVEVQSLTTRTSGGGPPRRSAQGIDGGRLAMLLAVMERRARLSVGEHEVFASAVGGVRLVEPGADLPTCLAIASAVLNKPLPPNLLVVGEVGLAGEVRQVAHAQRRLAEGARLGFTSAIVPANSPDSPASASGAGGIRLQRVRTISEAFAAAGLGSGSSTGQA